MKWNIDTHKYLSEITRKALKILSDNNISANSSADDIDKVEEILAQEGIYKTVASAKGRVRRALFTYFKNYCMMDEGTSLTPVGQLFANNRLSIKEFAFYYITNYQHTEGGNSYFPLRFIIDCLIKKKQISEDYNFISVSDFIYIVDEIQNIEDIDSAFINKLINDSKNISDDKIKRNYGYDVWQDLLCKSGIFYKDINNNLKPTDENLIAWIHTNYEGLNIQKGAISTGLIKKIPEIPISHQFITNLDTYILESKSLQAFLFDSINISIINKYIYQNTEILLPTFLKNLGVFDNLGFYSVFSGYERLVGYKLMQSKDERVVNIGAILSDIPFIKSCEQDENGDKLSVRPYITAIKSKPFLLLAGISGTGKSRIVRELARACWPKDSNEYKAQTPPNFEMVQVKPNWHDSSELIGYVSRVSGSPVFVAGAFTKFIAKAWENLKVPHFLCLDEMNLAPVEQYFAEYLSVVESRKSKDGVVTTDAILKQEEEQWFFDLTASLVKDEYIRNQFNTKGISIPQNLIVIGTVNMDETTFSFSRKVLDRAMTIEMNKVDLEGGLTNEHENIDLLTYDDLIGTAVEGKDVYSTHKALCNKVITYMTAINSTLEGTPFMVAYRTRNEFLLYVVNNLPYNLDEEGNKLTDEFVIARALDEITSMKILSRIEGDSTKVTEAKLKNLSNAISDGLTDIDASFNIEKSISLAKLKEMIKRLNSGYTSFWS